MRPGIEAYRDTLSLGVPAGFTAFGYPGQKGLRTRSDERITTISWYHPCETQP